MQPPDTITDGVVVLRQVREGDRAVVLSAMRDPLVRQWLNMPSKPADRDFDTLLRTVRDGRRTGDRYDYAVTENGADVPLGAVIASRRHRDNYEIAYLAGEAGRGRGLMTRAVRLLCDALLEEGVGRLEVRTHPDNEASHRLARRGGRRGRRDALHRASPLQGQRPFQRLPDRGDLRRPGRRAQRRHVPRAHPRLRARPRPPPRYGDGCDGRHGLRADFRRPR